ncbi:MAG: TauD/TfdA family dioxygenase [Burkholderiales bacterium]|nr:TauD/TfdA family dioxygenase [Burkholderiales bacterium]
MEPPAAVGSPFALGDDRTYRRWRDWKLALRPARAEDLVVDVADARALTTAERDALRRAIGRGGCALYRTAAGVDDRSLPRRLGAQLGVFRLDANWLADDDGISPIAVSDRSDARDGRGGFIPYTDRPIRWHTDGYYHPAERTIRAMVLHGVRPARAGGENALLDPELAYLALRDASPAHIRALMQPDAMTIPARDDDAGVARAAQAGPVFSIDADGRLHLRYTARTRSIVWKDDAPTRAAVAALEALLATSPWVQRVRLGAGMGLVGHNVLHDRSGFADDPAAPRLLYRARFVDRIATPLDDAWR